MAELPHLVQVAQEFEADGGRVIAISEDFFIPDATEASALEAVRKAATKRALPFPIFVLIDKTLDGLNDLYDLPGPIPCTIAVDADGKEVDRAEDGADLERLRQMMRRALGK